MSLRKRLFPAKAFVAHWLNAVDEHSLHSPFLYRFYSEVVKNDSLLPSFASIEARRAVLLRDKRIIRSPDPGAGSLVHRTDQRKVSDIARHSLSGPPFCRMLYRLARYADAQHVLEVGSSLGISSAYLAIAAPGASFYTIEGNKEIAAIAEETFSELGIKPNLLTGNAAEILPLLVAEPQPIDLVYIDAHHTEKATLHFFDTLLPRLHHKSVLVAGDIHWSAGMERAWRQLTAHPAVSLSIDIFHAGLLFFNPDLQKETQVLRF